LFLWHPILVLELDILGYVGKGAAPLIGQLQGESAVGFFPPHFPWSYEPSVISRSSEIVSADGWLMSNIWFLLSTVQFAIGTCGSSLCVCARWSYLLLFSPGGSCIALPLKLSGQLLPQHDGAIQFFCFF
jgi:hypothetical protein